MKEKNVGNLVINKKNLDNYSLNDFVFASSVAMFAFNEQGKILAINSFFSKFFPNVKIGNSIKKISNSLYLKL